MWLEICSKFCRRLDSHVLSVFTICSVTFDVASEYIKVMTYMKKSSKKLTYGMEVVELL